MQHTISDQRLWLQTITNNNISWFMQKKQDKSMLAIRQKTMKAKKKKATLKSYTQLRQDSPRTSTKQ